MSIEKLDMQMTVMHINGNSINSQKSNNTMTEEDTKESALRDEEIK